jgi:hypothetical protein
MAIRGELGYCIKDTYVVYQRPHRSHASPRADGFWILTPGLVVVSDFVVGSCLQGLGVGPGLQFHQGHILPQHLHEADQWYTHLHNHDHAILHLSTLHLCNDDSRMFAS